jgi:DNA/RNA endonuclease YhcR with UshA esterase domain
MRLPRMVGWRHCLVGAWIVALPVVVHAADAPAPAPVPIAPAPAAAPVAAAAIAGSRAGDYVGQDVTVEGRVAAIHESPLATVVAFSPNFAGFTATILAADRAKFPSDLEARIRDRVVRVSGTVTTYRGKPEMALRDPAQLALAPPPGPESIAAHPPLAPAASPDGSMEEIRRTLARMEARLQALDARVTTLEQVAPDDDAVPVPAR